MLEPKKIILSNFWLQENINASVKIGRSEYQVVAVHSMEKVNVCFEVYVKFLVPKNEKFNHKMESETEITYCNRRLNGILWSAKKGFQVCGNYNEEKFFIWEICVRPNIYALKQDLKSDVYEGDFDKIFSEIVEGANITRKGKIQSNSKVVVRYQETGFDFIHNLIAEFGAQYHFLGKDIVFCEAFSKKKAIEIKGIQEIERVFINKPKAAIFNIYEREKSLKREIQSQKIMDSSFGSIELNVFSKQKETSSDNSDLLVVKAKWIGDLNIGDTVILDDPDYKNEEYYVVGIEQNIDSLAREFVAKTTVTLSKGSIHHSQRIYNRHNEMFRGVVCGEKGKIAAKKGNVVPINYIWQKSEVQLLAEVAMVWSGGVSRGMTAMPRAGDEVIVQCIEGELSAPVIIGSLTNVTNHLPCSESDPKVILRTSYKEDKPPNELVMDDSEDRECLSISATRDMQILVENDSKTVVKGERDIQLAKSRKTEIVKNESLFVKEGDYEVNLDGQETKCKFSINNGEIVQHVKYGNKKNLIDSGDYQIEVKNGDMRTVVKNGVTLNASNVTIQCGDSFIKIDGDSVEVQANNIRFNATKDIELSANRSVNIQSNKVSVSGKTAVEINTSGSIKASGFDVGVSAQKKLSAKGNVGVDISSSGVTNITGSLVKLN